MTSTTIADASVESGPRARLSAMTAIVTVGDTPMSTVAVSATAAARSSPTSSGADRQPRPGDVQITAESPIQTTATVTSPIAAIVASRRPHAVAVCTLQPGDERDERDRKAARDAQIARHRLGDDVGDGGTAEQTEDRDTR